MVLVFSKMLVGNVWTFHVKENEKAVGLKYRRNGYKSCVRGAWTKNAVKELLSRP